MNDFGYGQLDPNDFANEFAVTCFIVRQMIGRLDTMKLVQVQKVTGGGGAIAAAGTVDVLPLVNQIDGNNNATPHGTVYGLPWWRLQGGTGAVICDPAVGDIGYVSVSDRDISSVKTNKARSNPGSRRKYDIADGVYVGGLLNSAPTQYIAFADAGISVVDAAGNMIVTSSGGVTITPITGQPATVQGPLIVTGNASVGANLGVTGNTAVGGNLGVTGDSHVTGNTTMDGALGVTGAATLGSAHVVGAAQIDTTLAVGTTLAAGTSIAVAGGTPLKRMLTGSKTTNFGGAIGGGSFATTTLTVTGAKVGDTVVLGMSGLPFAFVWVNAFVSAADTVTLAIGNASPGTQGITSRDYTVLVLGTT